MFFLVSETNFFKLTTITVLQQKPFQLSISELKEYELKVYSYLWHKLLFSLLYVLVLDFS